MIRTINVIRAIFLLVCIFVSYVVARSIPEWNASTVSVLLCGLGLGVLVILLDLIVNAFSISKITALVFGAILGGIVASLVLHTPFFQYLDEKPQFIAQLILFGSLCYLGAVTTLRNKDEFHLVIPFLRFVPHETDSPIAVVDISALIDGRISSICKAKFLNYALVVPRWVLDDLQELTDSDDPTMKARGRKGMDVLNDLRRFPHIDLRISEVPRDDDDGGNTSIVELADRLKAKLLTTNFNLAKIAEFHNVEWLNLNSLAKALSPELLSGDIMDVDLVKQGREPDQAVGYMPDGSMVVVNDACDLIGQRVRISVQSVIPSGGGRMIFAKLK